MYARGKGVGVLHDLARERYVKLGRTCMLVIQRCIQWSVFFKELRRGHEAR
jgi:hypothetical protein